MRTRWWAFGLALASVSNGGWSQATSTAAASGPCTLDAPSLVSSAPNIFTDRQEQDLGDALAEYEETHLRLVAPTPDDQLTKIGERLLAVLPPTGVHYRFRLYDSGEVNGFSLAGGRVYISRKLVAAVKNEDELAGVLAHEIGHISTHQTAIEFTRIFRIRLGVTQVGDRADIFAKVHQMFTTPAKPEESKDPDKEEKKDQFVADRVGLYAVVRAGYSAESFASFLDESMVNKGKTGNWLSDLVGLTHEASQRYRTALKLIATLPPGCKGKPAGSAAEFTAWKKIAVEERTKLASDGIEGDRPLKLDPPLRPSMWRIRFSLDGKYVLGQDEAGISVADRAAGKMLFRIDAPDVEAAQFTPDSQSVVFHDTKLRVEQWTIATGKRAWVKEMVVFDGCGQTALSSDGRTLVCASMSLRGGFLPKIGVRLIDVESGKVLYDKPNFYETAQMASSYWWLAIALAERAEGRVSNIVMSPDGRYLVVAVVNKAVAFDLGTRQQIALSGKLHDLGQQRMGFLGPDEVLVVGESKGMGLSPARILSFPDGRVVKDVQVGDQALDAVSKGRFLLASPLKSYAVGILDPEAGKFIAESKFPALDIWESYVGMEGASGGLYIGQRNPDGTANPTTTKIALPLGELPRPRSGEFSADGRYLVISLRNRAEIWDLSAGTEMGKQVRLIRPFRSEWMDDADRFWAQFPKYVDKDPTELEISVATTPMGSKDLGKFEGPDFQYRDLQFRFKPILSDKDKKKEEKDKKKKDGSKDSGKDSGKDSEEDAVPNASRHAMLEVKKMETQAVAWTREYPHEVPACWPAEDNRLVLGWDLSSDAAKAEMKSYPALQQEAAALKMGKRGLLLETVEAGTGVPREQVVVPEADLSGGWEDEGRAIVSGGFVMVRGEHENTVIYKLDTGVKVGEFFGDVVATNASLGLIAAVNREAELSLLEEKSGKELKRFALGSPVRVVRITGGKDKTLLVLTADQVVHRLPLPE